MIDNYLKYLVVLMIYLLFSSVLIGQEQKTCNDCHANLMKNEFKHSVAEDACDNCHQTNENSHPSSPGNEFSLSAEGTELCYMCHEAKNTKANIHEPIKNGYCWMCHSPHSTQNKALLTKSPVKELCYMCHDLEIPQKDIVHAPVSEGACNECHDSHQSDNPGFLKGSKSQVCFNCHETEKQEAALKNIHYPFDDDCSTCHKPHNSEHQKLMTEPTPGICFNCHDDYAESVKNMQSSHSILFDKKNCSNCHSPHASAYSSMLKKDAKDVCLTCHSKMIRQEKIYVRNIGQAIKKGKSVHAAIEMDGCATCHKPHFSEHAFLLTGKYPEGRYTEAKTENFGLCFDCHDTGLLETKLTTDATNFRDNEKNMHYIHINGKKGRSCSLCHDMHASENEHLISEKKILGNWEMSMNYKVTSTGGSCFPGCHGEKTYTR